MKKLPPLDSPTGITGTPFSTASSFAEAPKIKCLHPNCHLLFHDELARDQHWLRRCKFLPGNLPDCSLVRAASLQRPSPEDGKNGYVDMANEAQDRATTILTRWRRVLHMGDHAIKELKGDIKELLSLRVRLYQVKLADHGCTCDSDIHELARGMESPFRGLETASQEALQRDRLFSVLKPHPRVLKSTKVAKWTKCMPITQHTDVTCYDVVIEENLQHLWHARPEIYFEMIAYVRQQMSVFDGTVYDVCDTEVWRNCPVIKACMELGIAYQGFGLHADDLELCNALGLWAGKHKVHITSAVLLGLNPVSRFSLENLMLVNIVLNKDIKAGGGIHLVISGPQDEKETGTSWGASMLRWNQGIELQTPEGPAWFQGGQHNSMADSPEAGLLTGMKNAFGPETFSPCRGCDANKNTIKSSVCFVPDVNQTACPFQLRTADEHAKQCAILTGKAGYSDDPCEPHRGAALAYSMQSGINTPYHAFYRVPGHPVVERTTFDLMHLEFSNGVFVNETYFFLFTLIKVLKWVTVPQLNAARDTFDWNVNLSGSGPPAFLSSQFNGRSKKSAGNGYGTAFIGPYPQKGRY